MSPLAPAAMEARARPSSRAAIAAGPRFFQGLVVGLFWLLPALVDVRFVYAMLLWDIVLVCAWSLDVRRMPAASTLTVQRTWSAPPALGVTSSVRLTIGVEGGRALRLFIIDTVPDELRGAPPDLTGWIAANGVLDLAYDISPRERGEVVVGDVYVRYQTTWRLAERWARAEMHQTVVIFPNLEEAKRESAFLIRSRQTDIERRTRRARGAGRFFESLREYHAGDELRDVCWTATARRGKLVTRLYETERSQPIWIVIDTGRLMRARVDANTKLDRAVNAALSLSQVALASGDRVGLLTYGRDITHRLAPNRGTEHLRHIVEGLARVRTEDSEANHVHAASRLALDQRRRSLIVWMTDVPDVALTPDVITAASQLTARHVVLFVVIGHEDLHRVARRAPATVEDMYETTAAAEVLQRRELLLHRLEGRGALTFEVTANWSLALVNAYLDVKQQNRV